MFLTSIKLYLNFVVFVFLRFNFSLFILKYLFTDDNEAFIFSMALSKFGSLQSNKVLSAKRLMNYNSVATFSQTNLLNVLLESTKNILE